MKKLLSLALVALLASASQAVTTVWSDSGTYTSSGSSTGFTANIFDQCSGLVTATITLDETYASDASTTVLALTNSGSTSGNYAYVTLTSDSNGSYTLGLTVKGNPNTGSVRTASSSINLTAGDTAKVGLYITRTNGFTVSLYYDGEIVASITGQAAYTGPLNTLSWTASSSLIVSDMTVYQGAAGSTTDAAALQALGVSYTNTAPEPTALALLALGVAGLALKRRAA